MTFAFIFGDVGIGEWFVLLAVILVVVGPKRLPETARKFGNWYGKFRRAADSFRRQLMDMDSEVTATVDKALTVEEVEKVPESAPSTDHVAHQES